MRDPEGITSKTYGLGYRHVMALLALLLGFVVSVVQVGMTVGIVSMTSKNSSNQDFEEFDWPSTGKNAILSSYFWGSLLGSLPAGYLGQKLNVKFLIMGGTSLGSILSSLTPTVARTGGWQGYCVLACFQGFVSSLFAPGIYIIMSRWAARAESTTLLGIANLGTPLGTAISLPVCGFLANGPYGWPSMYYFGTLVAIVWTIIFFIFGSQSPNDNRFISEAEKEYIVINQNKTVAKKTPPIPWGKLLTSRAVIILFLAETCNGFGSSIIQSEIPSYVHDVLDLPISLNGIVSAMPWICICTLLYPSSWLADYFFRKGILSRTVSKKVYTLIGLGMNGVLLILCGIVGDNLNAAIVLICAATACATFTFSGFHTTHLDIAPNFAGVLAALTSVGGHSSGVLAPITVGLIVKNNSVAEWTWVFIETGSVLVAGSIIYLLFGSTDLQSWNNVSEDDDEKDRKNQIIVGS